MVNKKGAAGWTVRPGIRCSSGRNWTELWRLAAVPEMWDSEWERQAAWRSPEGSRSLLSRSFSVWDSHGPVTHMGLKLNRLDHPRVCFFFVCLGFFLPCFLFGATGVSLLEITIWRSSFVLPNSGKNGCLFVKTFSITPTFASVIQGFTDKSCHVIVRKRNRQNFWPRSPGCVFKRKTSHTIKPICCILWIDPVFDWTTLLWKAEINKCRFKFSLIWTTHANTQNTQNLS